RAYPFTMARIEGSDRWAMVFDNTWEGMSRTEGVPLFNEKGEASELLNGVHKFVQELETDIERTRQACAVLMELKLLKPMRFDATLANGESLSVDGFLTADEEAIAKLSDAQLAQFYRNGLLGLVQTHLVSLNNMRRLLDRRLAQAGNQAAPQAANS
ncbi:MAG: SapC family protein, partial [Betaproteobacteria bacterium]